MPLRRADLLAGAAIVAAYLGVRSGRTDPLDAAITRAVGHRVPPRVDRAVAAVTDVGSVYGASGITAALAATGHRRTAVEVAFSSAMAWTGAQAAKPLLHRPRPYETRASERTVAIPAGSSWPSGHAAVAAAVATVVAERATPRTRWLLATAVAGVGLSRLQVGVHHATDVLAGVGTGVLSGRLATVLRSRIGRRARPARRH